MRNVRNYMRKTITKIKMKDENKHKTIKLRPCSTQKRARSKQTLFTTWALCAPSSVEFKVKILKNCATKEGEHVLKSF